MTIKTTRFLVTWLFIIFIPSTNILSANPPTGPLKVHPQNPRYFADRSGKAVYLTGSHSHPEFQDYIEDPPFPYSKWLSDLVGWGHNFMRGWHWEDAYYSPLPYQRTGPGKALDGKLKFDLTKYQPRYFDHVKTRIQAAADKGLYVSVMLFQGWSFDKGRFPGKPDGYRNPNPWPYHPYNIANNINGINGDPNGDNQGGETHRLLIPEVTALQEKYVEHTIDQLNHLDNIIWEISNECWSYSVSWQYHMVKHIKSYQKTKPKQHLVWMNARGDWNNNDLYNSPADIISPNNGTED
ncbi:MAG: hypothetical protein ACYTF1_12170 [Planctomycetota bacterium]|jgi:hypothetical protein